jgi:hypothetical protein
MPVLSVRYLWFYPIIYLKNKKTYLNTSANGLQIFWIFFQWNRLSIANKLLDIQYQGTVSHKIFASELHNLSPTTIFMLKWLKQYVSLYGTISWTISWFLVLTFFSLIFSRIICQLCLCLSSTHHICEWEQICKKALCPVS